MQEIYQERVVSHRQAEFKRLKREREERISRILQSRRQEREKMRKLKFYLKLEEERQQKLCEEEEARKREGNYFLFLVFSMSPYLQSVLEHLNDLCCFIKIFLVLKGNKYVFQFQQIFKEDFPLSPPTFQHVSRI